MARGKTSMPWSVNTASSPLAGFTTLKQGFSESGTRVNPYWSCRTWGGCCDYVRASSHVNFVLTGNYLSSLAGRGKWILYTPVSGCIIAISRYVVRRHYRLTSTESAAPNAVLAATHVRTSPASIASRTD